MKMAITNLMHSCVIMTAERQVVGGVYWRVRAGCIPNCSARSVIDAMASNLREGAAPAPGAVLLFADTDILLSLLFGCCGVDRTIRFDRDGRPLRSRWWPCMSCGHHSQHFFTCRFAKICGCALPAKTYVVRTFWFGLSVCPCLSSAG